MAAAALSAGLGADFWESAESPLLLNPRWPSVESARLRALVAGVPALRAHVWLASSGSTGALKCVALAKSAVLASARSVNAHLGVQPGDAWCRPLPDFHVGGLGIAARAFLSGSVVHELTTWDPAEFVALCARHRVRWSALVPAQISDLVTQALRPPANLRGIVVGGGALRENLYAQARALGWPLLPSYGMSETASQVATATMDSLADRASLGFPSLVLLPHADAWRTADGRLAFRGASLFRGYAEEGPAGPRFRDPKQEGVFISEDRGDVRNDGNRRVLCVEGRTSDFIKIGGESVDLARLDALLAACVEVERAVTPGFDAALVAIADERLGHVVHLAATQPEGLARVRAAFDARVLPFERARQAHLVARIPRSELGKLRRRELEGAVLTSTNTRLS